MGWSDGEGNMEDTGESARDPTLGAGSGDRSSFVTGDKADGVGKNACRVLRCIRVIPFKGFRSSVRSWEKPATGDREVRCWCWRSEKEKEGRQSAWWGADLAGTRERGGPLGSVL